MMTKLPFDPDRPHHQKLDLSEERMLEILRDAHYGFLSTVQENGEPYGVPIGFAFDESDNSLIFHTANQGLKMDNLRRDDRVCFAIVGSSDLMTQKFAAGYESLVIFGRMQRAEDPADALRCAMVYCRKFTPEIIAGMDTDTANTEINDLAAMIEKSSSFMSMYRLIPSHISGKQRKAPQK